MGAFTGCSDWLDYTPKDKETEDQTFSSNKDSTPPSTACTTG